MPSVKDVFKFIAPFLTTALNFVPGGGVVANLAASTLSKVLDGDVTPDKIESVITDLAGTENGRIKLKEAEQEFQKVMTELGFDHVEKMAELQMADRASAREREKVVKDRMPATLAIMAVFTLIFCICLIAFVKLPEGAKDALLLLIGFVGASYKDVYGYFFGSSAGSEQKTELLASAKGLSVADK